MNGDVDPVAEDRESRSAAGVLGPHLLGVGEVVSNLDDDGPEHVRESCGALDFQLTDEDLAELDVAFPPPPGPQPLEML